MFPYSIKGRALEWFQQLPETALSTWESLSTEFLSKYYPSDKTQQMRAIILSFKAQQGEGLYQAWERYKALVEKVSTSWLYRMDDSEYLLRSFEF